MHPSPDFITSYGILAEKLGNAQTRDDIAEVLFEFIEQNAPMPFMGFYLYDAEQQKLLNVKGKGFTDEQRAKAEESVMDRHPGKAFRENRVLWIPDTRDKTADQHVTSPRDFEVRSALVIPVCSDEQAIGVLTMASDKVRYFSEQMRDIMSSACNITG
ncbi:MAG: GAF domain-containing protein, partial [Flavobacteriales bacterium]